MDTTYLKRYKVCIVLLNYFNNEVTLDCVRSVLGSDLEELPFIVVVDNSNKSSALEEDLNFYPDIKYLFPGKNLGFARGVNHGIGWAGENLGFEYLFILNNDTILANDTIGKLITAAKKNPSVTIFTPCVITEEPEPRIWNAGGRMNYFRMTPLINNIGKFHIGDFTERWNNLFCFRLCNVHSCQSIQPEGRAV